MQAADNFDVIIDDGSHASYHQLVTLRTLFPKVRLGGLYIIEDMHWQPAELELTLPQTPPIATLLRDERFVANLGLPVHAVEILEGGKLGILQKPLARDGAGVVLPVDEDAMSCRDSNGRQGPARVPQDGTAGASHWLDGPADAMTR